MGALLSDYTQLSHDPRKSEGGDSYNDWLDEIVATEEKIIAAYVKQFELPERLANILISSEFTDDDIEGMAAELRAAVTTAH